LVACSFLPVKKLAEKAFAVTFCLRLALSASVAFCALAIQVFVPLIWSQTPAHSDGNLPETAPFTEQMLPFYDGQNVAAVELAGHPDLNSSEYAPLLQQKAGQPFSESKIQQTVAALKLKGSFKAVRVRVEPEADGLRVIFVLEPAIYFGIYDFPGAGRFAYPRLLQVANYPERTAFNRSDVEQAAHSLTAFFQQQGYFHAAVQPQVTVDASRGVANVHFHTDLGERAKFDSTNIQGVSNAENKKLHRKLRSLWARLWGAAIRPGKSYNYDSLTRAQKNLQHSLQSKGLLSAQVSLAGAEYNPKTNQASIHFTIKPGFPTHVEIKGAHLWSWTRKSLLPFYQGVGVDQETVDEGRQALVSYFQRKGYFNVDVRGTLLTNSRGDNVRYLVTKRKKHKVAQVTFSGNKHISSSTLMAAIQIKQASLFSRGEFSRKLLSESVNNLTSLYQSEGFSSANVKSRVADKNRQLHVSFQVTEGPQDIVNSLVIEGDQTFPESQFAPNGLQIAVGKPYSSRIVEADRASIVAHYHQAGYLRSSFRETASEASKRKPHRIDVIYHIYEGPRVSTGQILTLGRKTTQQRVINEGIASLKPGKPLTESDMLRAGTALYDDTGVFDWAEVETKRPITTQSNEDVLIKVHQAKRNEFTYGFGFEVINRGGSVPSGTVALPSLPPVGLPSNFTTSQKTFYGPRGTAQYTRNDLFGKGASFSLTAFAGRLDQRGAVYLIDPKIFWTAWRASASFSIEQDEENPIFSFKRELSTFQLQKPIDRAKHDTLFLRYSFDKTDLTRILIPALVQPRDRSVRLSTLAANLTRDTRDNPLDEHSGVLRSLELDLNVKPLGSSVNFAKMTGQIAFYKEKFDHTVWAESIRLGLEEPFANSFVPLSEKFFSGGGNSLRGFPLDGAGPQRSVQICSNGTSSCACPPNSPDCSLINVPEGGNELLILNSEARIPLPFMSGLRIVPFYDGGNVFPSVGFHNFGSLYSNNVGLGLRYETPVGPIRVDVGRNLNPVSGIKATQYFISIGQAF
jgi:outer membrane protein insertion porin family